MDQRMDVDGRIFHKVARLYQAPEWVKQASDVEIRCTSTAVPALFADPAGRQFPCHTKAATWTSAAFLAHNGHLIRDKDARDRIEKEIRSRAALHGISQEVDEVFRKAAEDLPEIFADSEDEGSIVRLDSGDRFPIRNAEEVKAAASYLKRYRRVLVYADRQKLARAILDSAERFGVPLPDEDETMLLKTAGIGVCSLESAGQAVIDRIRLLKARGANPDSLLRLKKWAQDCFSEPELLRQPEFLSKLASFLDHLDREYEIQHRDVPIAEESLFAVTTKEARQAIAGTVKLASGHVYRVDDLDLHPDTVQDLLGTQVFEACSNGLFVDKAKLAASLRDLDFEEAFHVASVLDAMGVEPVYRTPIGSPPGWEDLQRSAADGYLRSRLRR